MPTPWPLNNKKVEHSNLIFDIVSMETQSPLNHKDYTFYRIECGDWVNILPLTADKEVVLVNQYRVGTEADSLEIPGGLIEKGEEPRHAALREMEEETGYVCGDDKVIDLGWVWPNPAIQTNKCFLFAAESVYLQGKQKLDEMEDIEIVLMPWENFMGALRQRTIAHSLVLDTVFRYLLQKGRV